MKWIKEIKKVGEPIEGLWDAATMPEVYDIYELSDDEIARNNAPGRFMLTWQRPDEHTGNFKVTKKSIDRFIRDVMGRSVIMRGFEFGDTARECELELRVSHLESQITSLGNLGLRLDVASRDLQKYARGYNIDVKEITPPDIITGEDVKHGKED